MLDKALGVVSMDQSSPPLSTTILGHKAIVQAKLGQVAVARQIVELIHKKNSDRGFFYYVVWGHVYFHSGKWSQF